MSNSHLWIGVSLLLCMRIDHTGCMIALYIIKKKEDILGSSLGCRGFIVETERGIAEVTSLGLPSAVNTAFSYSLFPWSRACAVQPKG